MSKEIKMKINCPLKNEKCMKDGYNAKSCLVISENDELNKIIKSFFEPKNYVVKIKQGDFINAGDFCKFCETAHSSGFGIMIGKSLFELGFLYGLGKPLILNKTPDWTKDTSEINNVVYLENIDYEGLKGARFIINEKLKKDMVERFIHEKTISHMTPDLKEKIEKLSEILLENDFSLSVIRKHKEVEISADDKYRISEIITEIENSGLAMTIEYYLTTGRFFFEVDEFKNAIKQFEKALEIHESNVEALTDTGTSYYYLKRYDEAIEYFRKATEIEPENVYALHTMGMAHVHLKKHEAAIEYFKKALKVQPNYEIFNDLGIVYNYLEEDKERYDKAIECFKNSLKTKDNIRAWMNMGATYIHLKNYPEAIECFKNALKIQPENAKIISNIGGAYFRLKDYANAIKYFKDAIAIEPNNAETHYSLGLVYNNLKNYNEAITYFKGATEIDPEHVDAWWDLGFTYTHFGDYPKALEYFEKAAEIDGEYVDAWNSMGAAYTKLGKYDKAGECYNKVIQILPKHVPGKLNISENYIIRGMYDRALLHTKESLKIAKENKNGRDICVSYFFEIVSLLFHPGKIADAKIRINEFIKYFEENPSKVDWDFSVIISEVNKSHLEEDIKNLIYALSDLLQNKMSVEEFVTMAKKLDI